MEPRGATDVEWAYVARSLVHAGLVCLHPTLAYRLGCRCDASNAGKQFRYIMAAEAAARALSINLRAYSHTAYVLPGACPTFKGACR